METATHTPAINLAENQPSPPTYEFLREEGLKHIRELGGNIWSDHNVGDPGITILEVLCVAIADISARIGLDVKELIANPKGELYDNIYSPAAILPCNPLTITDFRKLLIDLPEVKNAWIEPANDSAAIYHNRISQSISSQGPEEDKVMMQRLYTVFVEAEEGKTSEEALIAVKDKLSKHRNLCEDFPTIQVSDPQEIAINATLEISEVSDVAQLLAEIYAKLDRFIAPRVRFYTLQELLDKGKRIDEIMEGPWLENGFIDTQELERYTKKKELRSSDLIQEIMDIPGVTLVKHIQMYAKQHNPEGQVASEKQADPDEWQQASWILPLDPDKAPKLIDPGQEKNIITLMQGSVTVGDIDWDTVKDKYHELRKASASTSTKTQDFKLEKSSVRVLEKYDSIQNKFPNLYGVGKYGLSESISSLRKAQAKQLKAYLLFFDQLLANYLSQLANVKDLFAYDEENAQKELKTYFAQSLFKVVPNIDTVISKEDYEEILSVWDEKSSAAIATARARKNRFLNHLMARFGEKFNEHAFLQYTSPQEAIQSDPALKARYDFLQNYPTVSSQRATQVGLQQRIRILLGLTDAETFEMIEHIALRPTNINSGAFFFTFARPLYLRPDTNPQYTSCHSPNHGLEAGDVIVVRDTIYYQGIYKVETEGREKNKFKVKQQAHFKFYKALDAGQWFKYGTHRDPFSLQLSFVFPIAQNERFSNKAFQTYAQEVIRAETPAHIKVYTHWLEESQMETLEEKENQLEILDNPLNLGRVLPWQEPNANLIVAESTSETGDRTFTIGDENEGSEKHITYYVRNAKTEEPLGLEEGNGDSIRIPIPADKISQDTTFDILALDKASGVGVELIQVSLGYAVVIAGTRAKIIVKNSQQETIYELVDAVDDKTVMSEEPKAGTGDKISLFTKQLQSDTTLRIRTTSSEISKIYKKDILIEILRTNLNVTHDQIVFSGGKASIKLQGSQRMVNYELIDSKGDGQPIATEEGNGGEITLTTNELTTYSKFKFRATTLPSMANDTETHPNEYLEIELCIEVHLQLSLIPAYPLPVHVGFPANVKLKSYEYVTYQLKSAVLSTEPYDNPIS